MFDRELRVIVRALGNPRADPSAVRQASSSDEELAAQQEEKNGDGRAGGGPALEERRKVGTASPQERYEDDRNEAADRDDLAKRPADEPEAEKRRAEVASGPRRAQRGYVVGNDRRFHSLEDPCV